MSTGDIRIEAWFDQPPSAVFQVWTTPDDIASWFAVPPWQVTHVAFDARPGEAWSVDFSHPDGSTYREQGEVLQVEPAARLVFTLRQVGMGGPSPLTTITVTFRALNGGTQVAFVQNGFDDNAHRDGNATGWEACLQLLRRRLNAAA